MNGRFTLVAMVGLCAAGVIADDRFIKEIALSGGMTAVVAEGDLEPRSTGTYTVRIYKDLKSGAFVTGLTKERDGAICNIGFGDLNKDGRKELFVETKTSLQENYINIDVFDFDGVRLKQNPKLSLSSVPEEKRYGSKPVPAEEEKKPEAAKPAAEKPEANVEKPAEKPAESANTEVEKPKVDEKAAKLEAVEAVIEPAAAKPDNP
jgi:hypothetical protein